MAFGFFSVGGSGNVEQSLACNAERAWIVHGAGCLRKKLATGHGGKILFGALDFTSLLDSPVLPHVALPTVCL